MNKATKAAALSSLVLLTGGVTRWAVHRVPGGDGLTGTDGASRLRLQEANTGTEQVAVGGGRETLRRLSAQHRSRPFGSLFFGEALKKTFSLPGGSGDNVKEGEVDALPARSEHRGATTTEAESGNIAVKDAAEDGEDHQAAADKDAAAAAPFEINENHDDANRAIDSRKNGDDGSAAAAADIETDDESGSSFRRRLAGSVALSVLTNDKLAGTEPGVTVPAGGTVNFEYVIRNSGSTKLYGLKVNDRMIEPATGAPTPICQRNELAPSEMFTCSVEGTAIEGQYRSRATVTAWYGSSGVSVNDVAYSNYFGTTTTTTPEPSTTTPEPTTTTTTTEQTTAEQTTTTPVETTTAEPEICFTYPDPSDPSGSGKSVTEQCAEAGAPCCTDDEACDEFVGTVCVRGTEGSCNGLRSCYYAGGTDTPVHISSGSCSFEYACRELQGTTVLSGSCNVFKSCDGTSVASIGEGSCNAVNACADASGVSVGSSSCTAESSCLDSTASIGDGMCTVKASCYEATDESIGSSTCSTKCCECQDDSVDYCEDLFCD